MYLGIDTSNYTTSVAVFDGREMHQYKQLLTVKEGERGLRQSEALFQHTVNLPKLIEASAVENLQAVGVSTRPRSVEGSYMPCFLAGESVARAVAKTGGVALYPTSHQTGHILAALYSADKLAWLSEPFIAFHLSGGTTEALLVTPDEDSILRAEIIAQSLDLKAGQAVDRTGVLLGLTFPCGKALDALSLQSEKRFTIKPSMKGADCSLSGVENKVKAMLQQGESREDIARYALEAVAAAVCAMLDNITAQYGALPVIFSGGVSSNTLLRETVNSRFQAAFAAPAYSLDNAAGVALYAYIKRNGYGSINSITG